MQASFSNSVHPIHRFGCHFTLWLLQAALLKKRPLLAGWMKSSLASLCACTQKERLAHLQTSKHPTLLKAVANSKKVPACIKVVFLSIIVCMLPQQKQQTKDKFILYRILLKEIELFYYNFCSTERSLTNYFKSGKVELHLLSLQQLESKKVWNQLHPRYQGMSL